MGILIYDQISIIKNCSKVKLRHAFSLGLGLKVVKIAWNVVKVGIMLVYLMGIQIYYQVSILSSCSKVKLHRAVLLGFGLISRK